MRKEEKRHMINKIDIAAKLRESRQFVTAESIGKIAAKLRKSRQFVTATSIGKIEWKSVEK